MILKKADHTLLSLSLFWGLVLSISGLPSCAPEVKSSSDNAPTAVDSSYIPNPEPFQDSAIGIAEEYRVPNYLKAPSVSDSSHILKALIAQGFESPKLYVSEGYSPSADTYSRHTYYAVAGDYFNDGIGDIATLIMHHGDTVQLVFLDYGFDSVRVVKLGGSDDPFNIYDYGWARVLETAEAGSTLWSNYEVSRRNFEDLKAEEKIVLNHDALFTHALDACGGGFIYWSDSTFHWLQQE